MISVIMPVYNVEKYLRRAVESVLNQTYRNFELILVDDGSTDGSAELCDAFAAKDGRVKVIHQKNGGLSAARNSGIDAASGEYLCFPDSDDYVEPEMLEEAVKAISEGFDLAVWGYFNEFELSGETVEKILPAACIRDGKNDLDCVPACLGYAWNKLYKREIIEKNNLRFVQGISLVEDVLFNRDYIGCCKSAVFIDKLFNHYLQREKPTLGTKFYPNAFELKKLALDAWRDITKKLCFDQSVADGFINGCQTAAVLFFVRMTARQKNLTVPEKRKMIGEYLKNSEVKAMAASCKACGTKNRFLLLLVRCRAALALTALLK